MEESVAEWISTAASTHGATIAVAESLTCDALLQELGRGSGASDWLAGGVVAYQTQVKVDLLGVTPGIDPCSADCAEQMAEGARHLLNASIAVSTTGVGGPAPDGDHSPGTVYVGWSDGVRSGHDRFNFEGDPQAVVRQSVDAALNALKRVMSTP